MVKTKKKFEQAIERNSEETNEKALLAGLEQQIYAAIGTPPSTARVTFSIIPGLRACRVNVWQKVSNKERNLLHPTINKLTNSYWITLNSSGVVIDSNPQLEKIFVEKIVRKSEDTD